MPTYNEEQRLDDCLQELRRSCSDRHWGADVELIIVDDGSTDGTVEVAQAQIPDFPYGRLLRLPWHTGKGAAVRLGVTAARGDAIVFMDADLATDLSALNHALAALEDADMAVGSRAIPGAVVTGRTRARGVLHHIFRSQVLRRLTGVTATDPQCGFKVFRNEVAKTLFAMETVDGFCFDVEILLLAQKLRYRVVEVPVHWRAVSGSHVRVLRDSLRILRDCLVVRLRWGRKVPLAMRPITHTSVKGTEPHPEPVSPLRVP